MPPQADPILVSAAQVNERLRSLALAVTQIAAKELQKLVWEPERITALARLLCECANDFHDEDEG